MNKETGIALTKEVWQQAAENILKAGPVISDILLKQVGPQGKKDAEHFAADMQLAYTAMMYVAEFATEKCRIIVVPDGEEHKRRKEDAYV